MPGVAAVVAACGLGRAVIAGLSLGGFMSLAFHLAHPARTEALMLFDTGPGYKKDDGRAGWNKIADSMAVAYEKKGLAAAGLSAQLSVAHHPSPQSLAHTPPRMLSH